jgi:hypothetical protein
MGHPFTTPPSAKRGGRVGHPELVTLFGALGWSLVGVLRFAQDDTFEAKAKTDEKATARATAPPSAK